MHITFCLENLKERDHLEDLGVDRNIILECILKEKGGRVDQIHPAQNRDHRWTLANSITNFRVPQKSGIPD